MSYLVEGDIRSAVLVAPEAWRLTGALRWANVSKTEMRLQQEWVSETTGKREWRDVPTVPLYEPDV